ncbi:MAG: Lrp/AsnC family transcriptional regulator [Anaerolineales bacterium]|nr:Lrp/AsnC family transcriptional regulator [Anaerolineales bacterium]
MAKPTIDSIDMDIIRKLQEDGRRSYADIAAQLGLSPSSIQQRAQRLLQHGLLKVRAVVDPLLMGYPVAATVALEVDGAVLREVAAQLAQIEEVGYVVLCAGSYDIQIEVVCRDNTHMVDLITTISKIEGVRSSETFMYLEIVKNNYQWGVPG